MIVRNDLQVDLELPDGQNKEENMTGCKYLATVWGFGRKSDLVQILTLLLDL